MNNLKIHELYINKLTLEICRIKTCAYLNENENEMCVVYKKENRKTFIKKIEEFKKEFKIYHRNE